MKIAIFGIGYVGLTSAACLLNDGHEVIGIDLNERKIEMLNAGQSPIYEPGLDELLQAGVRNSRFSARTDIGEDMADVDVAIVCVGTPSGVDGAHDMRYIAEVSHQVAMAAIDMPADRDPLTVVYRSTMRPGTIENLIVPIFQRYHGATLDRIELIYNPEFLRESTAIADYYAPPKIIVGTRDGKPSPMMDELYSGIEAPRFAVGYREAEITKFVDNSFHALKVAFANEIGRICLREGVSARTVHQIFVSDTKLNISPYYLRPGGAFGGSCLPKDVRALTFLSNETGAETFVIDSILRSNEAHKRFIYEMAIKNVKPGSRVLLNGLAFKSNSDDLRESPFVDLARRLLNGGYDLRIWDPQVEPASLLGHNLGYSFSHLPELKALLLRDIEELGYEEPSVVIDARGDAHLLPFASSAIVPINVLA